MVEKIEYGAAPAAEVRSVDPGFRAPTKIEFGGEGGGFFERLLASVPLSVEGRVSFLENVYGEGNVITDREGTIFFRDPRGANTFGPFDEDDATFKDFTADLGGDAIQTAALLVGKGKSATGAAVKGGAGSVARQAVAELLPGQEDLSPLERGGDVLLSTGLAGGTQKIVNTGAKAFDALRPGNIAARVANRAAEKTFAKKGRKLSEQTGIPLTFAEETGSRFLGGVEALGRRSLSASDEFFRFHQGQLRTAVGKVKTVMARISPERMGDLRVGQLIISTFDDAVEKARDLRRLQAEDDFAQLNRVSNGQPVIGTSNIAAEMEAIVREHNIPLGGGTAKQVVTGVRRMRDGLVAPVVKDPTGTLAPGTRQGVEFDGLQANALLENYTNLQRGTGVLIKDLDKGKSIALANRLKTAFLQDIDDAVARGGASEEVAAALTTARNNYKLNSAAVKELADSTLAHLIGNRTTSPEAIAEKFAKRLAPSEIRTSMAILEAGDPAAAAAVRRQLIETALVNARPPVSESGAEGIKFSAARFVRSMPDVEKMQAAGIGRAEMRDILRVAKVLERVADKRFEGSSTAPLLMAWDAIRGAFTLNPSALGRSGVALIGPRKIAEAMLTADGRAALTTIATTSAATHKALGSLMFLGLATQKGPPPQNVRPVDSPDTLEQVSP